MTDPTLHIKDTNFVSSIEVRVSAERVGLSRYAASPDGLPDPESMLEEVGKYCESEGIVVAPGTLTVVYQVHFDVEGYRVPSEAELAHAGLRDDEIEEFREQMFSTAPPDDLRDLLFKIKMEDRDA